MRQGKLDSASTAAPIVEKACTVLSLPILFRLILVGFCPRTPVLPNTFQCCIIPIGFWVDFQVFFLYGSLFCFIWLSSARASSCALQYSVLFHPLEFCEGFLMCPPLFCSVSFGQVLRGLTPVPYSILFCFIWQRFCEGLLLCPTIICSVSSDRVLRGLPPVSSSILFRLIWSTSARASSCLLEYSVPSHSV